MKITDIKQQVRRSDRYSIYIDGKFSFALSEAGLLKAGLYIGQEFNKEQVDELKQTAQSDKAYYQSLNYVMIRPRSEWELQQYLKRKDYSPALIEETLNTLSNNGYVDDAKFAKAWVDNRRLLRPTSKRRLISELRAKRVPSDAIDKALAEDETDELAVLRELIAKKRTQTRYRDKLKLMQYLSRQGYNYGDIKAALNEEETSA
jgi:regulatory protein